ncbi:hypothetical protein [Deinococcus enclensis]|uniref:Uncharacterized protein n=1 Tax=Deinococcus enclensis TaxID=1049582 RepID=A0ABT9MHQ9_9DEIO|nr:hypothetical protein [Deinococcus enclensis]MDP9766122.1 hypothetical protein [Deinococcus enclensis]
MTARHRNAAACLGAALLLNAPAQADGWGDLGQIMQQACRYSGTNGIPIDTGGNMEWACHLRSMYVFINNNLLNGDWEGFAKEVAGKYISDFLNEIAAGLGAGALNQYTAELNEALKMSYKEFRAAMLGKVSTLVKNAQNPNAGFQADSAGGMALNAIKMNPNLTLEEKAAQLDAAVKATQAANAAFKVKNDQKQATEAMEANVAPSLASAAGVLGSPAEEGKASQFEKDAAAAVSAREVAEVQVRLGAEQMRMDAVNTVAILNQLTQLTQQSVMTNAHLTVQRSQMAREMQDKTDELNARLEEEAQENLVTAIEISRQARTTYATAANSLGVEADFSDVAP